MLSITRWTLAQMDSLNSAFPVNRQFKYNSNAQRIYQQKHKQPETSHDMADIQAMFEVIEEINNTHSEK